MPNSSQVEHGGAADGKDERFELAGDLDLEHADRIEPALVAFLRSQAGSVVAIDCSNLAFIDSSGLGMLVDAGSTTGKRLAFENLPPSCRKVFELTGLDQVFDLR